MFVLLKCSMVFDGFRACLCAFTFFDVFGGSCGFVVFVLLAFVVIVGCYCLMVFDVCLGVRLLVVSFRCYCIDSFGRLLALIG